MTQIFAADGTVTPVTVIKAGPCVVVQKKSAAALTVTTPCRSVWSTRGR